MVLVAQAAGGRTRIEGFQFRQVGPMGGALGLGAGQGGLCKFAPEPAGTLLMLGDDIHAGWASLDDQVSSQNTCDEGQRKQTPNDIAARQIWDHHTPAYIRPGLRIPAGSKEALMPRVRVITASGCGSNTSMLERTSTGARTNIA